MGPIILLDKSIFQSLSHDEVGFLFKHYTVCIPPVLILEIMGDISKPPREEHFRFNDAQWLAQKVEGTDSGIPADCRKMLAASLLGNPIPMTGQIPVDTGVRVPDSRGGHGVIIEEPYARKLLRKWATGTFTDEERGASSNIRETIQTIDLEGFKQKNPPIQDEMKKAKSIEEVIKLVDLTLHSDDPDTKLSNLNHCLGMFSANEPLRKSVHERWLNLGLPKLADFAPYAYFCFRVYTTFIIGVSTGAISTRATNVIDLEYIWYLPFCWIFASSDFFHKQLVPPFLRADQEFVDGTILKADLGNIVKDWDSLDERGREERRIHFGSYPPEVAGSFTHRMHTKHCKPRSPYCGDPLARFPEEKREEIKRNIIDELNRKLKPYRDLKGE